MFPRTTFKGINVSIKLHCEGYVVFISAVTVYEPRVLTVAWKGFCLGCRLALRCYSVKSLCLSGMNRGRGSRKRRSGVIWHGWAHEQVPLLLSPQGERERHGVAERACWHHTDIWLPNPQATAVAVQAGLCLVHSSFLLRLLWEFASPTACCFSPVSPRRAGGVLLCPGSGLSHTVLECAFKRESESTRLTPFFSLFYPLSTDVSGLLPGIGSWICFCNIPGLQLLFFYLLLDLLSWCLSWIVF